MERTNSKRKRKKKKSIAILYPIEQPRNCVCLMVASFENVNSYDALIYLLFYDEEKKTYVWLAKAAHS